jgi:hypothetical protein
VAFQFGEKPILEAYVGETLKGMPIAMPHIGLQETDGIKVGKGANI